MDFEIAPVLTVVFLIHAFVVAGTLLLENRTSANTYSWLLVIFTIPVIGVVMYALVGKNWRKGNKTRSRKKKEIFKQTTEDLRRVYESDRKKIKDHFDDPRSIRIATLGFSAPYAHPVGADEVKLYTNGAVKFQDLLADIKAAKEYIHLEYYIVTSDYIVSGIVDALCKKAEEGVKVRFLYDWLGSFSWKAHDRRRLKLAGASVASGFSPLDKINYRSHRKLVIIDGHISYLGGMNLSSDYADGGKKFDSWRDNHLRLTGNVSHSIAALFAHYWELATKEKIKTAAPHVSAEANPSPTAVQLIHSGADTDWETIQQVYTKMIQSASSSVLMQTPYFIPDRSILTALISASLSGIKVKLILAGETDSLITQSASYTYFEELLTAGVEVFLYTKGFMHGKSLSIDGEICTIGSANVDNRSLSINYESNLVIYDRDFSQFLESQMTADLNSCKELKLSEIKNAKILTRLRWSFFALLSPLL